MYKYIQFLWQSIRKCDKNIVQTLSHLCLVRCEMVSLVIILKDWWADCMIIQWKHNIYTLHIHIDSASNQCLFYLYASYFLVKFSNQDNWFLWRRQETKSFSTLLVFNRDTNHVKLKTKKSEAIMVITLNHLQYISILHHQTRKNETFISINQNCLGCTF